jgi:hypothetical protein
VSTFLELAQTLQMAIKALQMYTAVHPRAQEALQNLTSAVGDWLKERPELQMAASAGKAFVDGAPVEGNSLHLTALIRQLTERQIAGFIIQRGAPPEELLTMLEVLILKPAKLEEMGGVAKVLAGKNLRFISLSQTQYREVREGEGGEDDKNAKAPAMVPIAGGAGAEGPGAGAGKGADGGVGIGAGAGMDGRGAAQDNRSDSGPEPLAIDIAEALDLWKQQLAAVTQGLLMTLQDGFLGFIPPANLSGLGPVAEGAGWGPGFPTANQMESLRQAMHGLPGESQLSIVKGINSLPPAPTGLPMGFQALAPEVVAQAAVGLLSRGIVWQDLKEALYEILSASSQKQAMMASLDAAIRAQGLGAGQFSDLLRQLEWDNQSMEEKIRRAIHERRLWDLTLEQRLNFLRDLLKQGRTEPLLRVLEIILSTLTDEAPHPREAAAQTLAGVTHWITEPDFPMEAEGPILDGLKGHFGWEPVPHIHRSTEEGLESVLKGFLQRGEIAQSQGLIQELQGLLAFLDENQEFRSQSLVRLSTRLTSPDAIARAVEALHQAEPEAVLSVFEPYFEFLGETGANELVRILGEEPERKRRGRLLDLIRALGPLAIESLKETLNSPTWYLVRNTLNLLGEMGDAGMLNEVARCLHNGDGRVRRAAVRALWKLGGPACASHLLPIFPTTDPDTQIEILFGLGQVQSGLAVFPLADFARNPSTNERMRIKTVETLGHIGNPSAIPALVELIRRKGRIFSTSESIELRSAAARALMSIGTPQAVEALRKLVDEEPRNKDREVLSQILATPGRPQAAP